MDNDLEEMFKPAGEDRAAYKLRRLEERKLLDEEQRIIDHLVHNSNALTKSEKVEWVARLKDAVLRYIDAINCAAIRRYARPGTWQAEAKPEQILVSDDDRWDFELAVPCGHASVCLFHVVDLPGVAIATVLDDRTRALQATFAVELTARR